MLAAFTSRLTHFAAFAVAVLGVVALYLAIAPGATRSDRALVTSDTTTASAVAQDRELQEAPDFALPTMTGDTFRLSEHRGQVVVLNFWATWCAPCREEIPTFIDMQRELGDEGVQFVGVSLDQTGFEVVRPYAEEMGINYPIVHDGDRTVAAKYGGVQVLPTTFIIGPAGKVHGYAPGMVTEDLLRPKLNELLAMVEE